MRFEALIRSGMVWDIMDAAFLPRLFDSLKDATPADCMDVVLVAASMAAHKRASTPRCVLDDCWKALDDERYTSAVLPTLEAILSPL